jgi:hypothetical protein
VPSDTEGEGNSTGGSDEGRHYSERQ